MATGRTRSGILDIIGLLAGAAVILGPTLAWLRVLPPLAGFYLFLLGGIASVVIGVTALVASARGRGFGVGRTVALVAAMIFLVTAVGPGGAPVINDYTTDLENPPDFRHAAMLPANAERDMTYPVGFAESQRACCPDLRSATVPMPPAEALQHVENVAAAMPQWTVTHVDPQSGTVEAVVESTVFGFEDDIVIRVQPSGAGSEVDVRSKSRAGRGDLGANAARIRSFVAALEASS